MNLPKAKYVILLGHARISRIFRVSMSFLLCGISSDPYLSGVRGTFRIFRIFAVSGSNR